MKFLAMIIALTLVHIWGDAGRVQRDDVIRSWQARVGTWALAPAFKLGLIVLVPAVVAQLLFNSLEGVLFGLLWIGLATLVLLYSFGRGDFHGVLQRYREHCRNGDFEAAWLAAGSESGWAGPQDNPAGPEDVHALVQRRALYEGYQRWFPALFYFVLLGPSGALAYRLLQLCRSSAEHELVQSCLFVADWLPARVLAAAFALTGDFVRSRDGLLDGMRDAAVGADDLLYEVARAAVGEEPGAVAPGEAGFGDRCAMENEEFAGLLSRSAISWVVVIALFVMLV